MNLSELVQQEDFGALIKIKGKWAAAKQGQVLNVKKDFVYDTPEEAIKALYEKV